MNNKKNNEGYSFVDVLVSCVILLSLLPIIYFSVHTFVTHFSRSDEEIRIATEYYRFYKEMSSLLNRVRVAYWDSSDPVLVDNNMVIFKYLEGEKDTQARLTWDEQRVYVYDNGLSMQYYIPNNGLEVALKKNKFGVHLVEMRMDVRGKQRLFDLYVF